MSINGEHLHTQRDSHKNEHPAVVGKKGKQLKMLLFENNFKY